MLLSFSSFFASCLISFLSIVQDGLEMSVFLEDLCLQHVGVLQLLFDAGLHIIVQLM